jgi:hypothetical protein
MIEKKPAEILETITIRKDYNEAEEDEMGGAYSTNG